MTEALQRQLTDDELRKALTDFPINVVKACEAAVEFGVQEGLKGWPEGPPERQLIRARQAARRELVSLLGWATYAVK